MKKYVIHEPMYGYDLIWYICPWATFKTHIKNTTGLKIKQCGAKGGKVELIKNTEGFLTPMLWLPWFELKPYCIGVLSHECLHIAYVVLNEVGIPVSVEMDEALCYLQEYYLEHCLEKVMK